MAVVETTGSRWSERARSPDPAALLAVLPAVLLHALLAVRGTSGAPSVSESAAVAAAYDPTLPVAVADLPFLRQLVLLGPAGGADLLSTARTLCLLAGVLSALLLWPIARRLLAGRDGAATAVVLAGSTPVALLLHAQVDAGAFAAFWLVAAAAVATTTDLRPSDTVPLAAAAVLAGCAVVTAPLVAVGLLAFAGHRMAGRLPVPGGGRVRTRLLVGAGTVAVAAAIALLAVTRTSPTTAADPIGTPLFLTTLLLGGAITALAHRRVVELRGLSVCAAAWLACSLWPGPARLTALLLALPVIALLAGSLVASSRHRIPVGAGAAVAAALTVAVLAAAWPAVLRPSPTHDGVARWVAEELDPATPLQAAAVDRVELVARGVSPARFVAGAAGPGTVRIVSAAEGCRPAETLLDTVPGGTVFCRAEQPAPPPGPAPVAALSAGFGAALATNPALTLSATARRDLIEGRVDSRLAMVLAGATAQYEMRVEEFPAGPGSSPDAPRTSAVIVADPGLAEYFTGQMPPYRPNLSPRPDGSIVLSFE